ncbi:hypothetical protein ACWGDS_06295 [Streptomyces sp. NPDC055059]|uniref:hypothetical protein n=1 Tax=Streptomyces sp. NPDC005507 TaxID=3154885 RepID=UPI0033B472B1
MKDDEVRARFDGRGRVELIPERATAARLGRIEEIAHALGYQRHAIENLGRAGTRLVYGRDDGPQARRRAELTIARLREGGPLLPAIEPPPPPPPSVPPPAPAQAPPRQRSRPLAAPPPPPPLFPPRPSQPPGPPSAPSNAPTS